MEDAIALLNSASDVRSAEGLRLVDDGGGDGDSTKEIQKRASENCPIPNCFCHIPITEVPDKVAKTQVDNGKLLSYYQKVIKSNGEDLD